MVVAQRLGVNFSESIGLDPFDKTSMACAATAELAWDGIPLAACAQAVNDSCKSLSVIKTTWTAERAPPAQHSYVAASSSSECSLPNLQITTTELTDIFDTIQAMSSASAIYLEGTPAVTPTAAAGNVTLAGAQVSVAGDWPRNAPYAETVSGNIVTVYVPAASAALVRVPQ